MANIRVDVDYQIVDGQPLTFKAPCPCSEVDGLTVYYAIGEGKVLSKTFTFKDAHGNDLTNVNELFGKNAYVKVVLNIKDGFAYIQNADTNAYLEGKFEEVNDKLKNKHPVGSVVITATNKNPSSEFGGTWTLIDKQLKDMSIDESDIITYNNKIDSNSSYVTMKLHNHSIRFEGTVCNATSIAPGERITIGNINFANVGANNDIATRFNSKTEFVLIQESGKYVGIPICFEFTTSTLNITNLHSDKTLPSSQYINISNECVSIYSNLDDNYCDKFYWKRTA